MRIVRFGAVNGLLPLALCCLGLSVAQAMDESSFELALVSEDEFLASVPIVLTATRISQRVTEAPASMTILDRDMIRASGFRDLVDVLRLVPGFQVAHGNGNYFVPTYHGLVDDFSRRMLVQVDGRSVYLPMLSTVNWNHLGIALEDVERIEAIRGSNNSVHGSNAFLGVINIITRQPFQDLGSTVDVVVGSLQAGGVRYGLENEDLDQVWNASDSREVFLRHGFSVKKWDVRISGKYREDQGFAGVHDSRYMKSVSARMVGSLNVHDQLDIQLGVTDGLVGVGYEDDPLDIGNPVRDMPSSSNYQYVTWSRSQNGGDEMVVRAYHNYYRQDDVFNAGLASENWNRMTDGDYAGIPFADQFPGITDQDVLVGFHDGEAERFDIEAQHVLKRNNSFELVLGAGVRQDSYRSYLMLGKEHAVYDLGVRLFSNINLHVSDRTNVNVGTMVEHNDIVGAFFSPRFAANYAFNDSSAMRFSLSHSQRSPSLLEANVYQSTRLADGTPISIDRVASDDLRTEKLNTIELGFVQRFNQWDTTLDVKLFREQLRDAIFDATNRQHPGEPIILDINALPEGGGVPDGVADISVNDPFVYLNGVDANLNGVEIQMQYRPRRNSYVSVQHGYIKPDAVQLRFINPDVGEKTHREVSEGVPYHTTSILASHQFYSKWELSAGFYRMTQMRWYGDGDRLLAYRRIDMRLGKSIRWDGKQATVAAVVQNLEKDYEEFRMENKFDQRAYLQASVSF